MIQSLFNLRRAGFISATALFIAPGLIAGPPTYHGPVKVLAAEELESRSANYFDLEGKTLRFAPSPKGYRVEVLPLAFDDNTGVRLEYGAAEGQWFLPAWQANLPFAFRFGSQSWTKCYINNNGNITFGQSESAAWSMRDPWPDGTMRSVAAALDLRAVMGQEAIIAALWAPYDQSRNEVRWKADSTKAVITWKVRRPVPYNSYYTPLGTNLFQVSLYASGVIEMSYLSVPERDGIVGVFSGAPDDGLAALLDEVDDSGDSVPAAVDVRNIRVEDVGSVIRFVLKMAQRPQTNVSSGSIGYRIFLHTGATEGQFGATVATSPYYWSSATEAPRVAGYDFKSDTVALYLSKLALARTNGFSWAADAVWWGGPSGSFDQVAYGNPRKVTFVEFGREYADLSEGLSQARSNVFEVFHYPVHRKIIQEGLASIYARNPPWDDMVVMLTDYRLDDLYSHGPGTGAINVPVQGIGPNFSSPQPGAPLGSTKVQAAVSPVFVGAPRFAEMVSDGTIFYHGHAFAVGWLGHELLHRWGAQLASVTPSGTVPLTDPYCGCHWSEGLNLAAAFPVHHLYSTNAYAEPSPLGGHVWKENEDGTFSKVQEPYLAPTGLSPLDLYIVGLIPRDSVPDTFLLQNLASVGNGRFRADKQRVSMSDIVSAMGVRSPAYPVSQTNFTLGVYLFHRSGQSPDTAWVERAVAISGALSNYFFAASGGRMKIQFSPARPPVLTITGSDDHRTLLQIEGEPGRTIALESSPDLRSWTSITNLTLPGLRVSLPVATQERRAMFFRASGR